ncbi:MAG TPA: dTMP kinase [Candidatus Sumerlaeota bacterium]|nr:dTMP kinase [Candidatus Sumerlaeota bacterium]HOR29520.1 dTMP kinase [Candidatus Sumerlaeota bacterium]
MTQPPSPSAPSDSARPGRLIVIEGIDGTGKTTLARLLADALRESGREVVLSREPTDGPHGRRLRESARQGRHPRAEEEAALFLADRRDHVERLILPALRAGRWVVLDRYFYSTMAYQGARGLDPAEIERSNRAFAPSPDLLVLLELPVEDALERIRSQRGTAPDHFEGRDYLEQVAKHFAAVEHPRLLRLDARLAPDQLLAEVMRALRD